MTHRNHCTHAYLLHNSRCDIYLFEVLAMLCPADGPVTLEDLQAARHISGSVVALQGVDGVLVKVESRSVPVAFKVPR